ncbi:hypothetical protein CEUSTIGMA_g2513.t1 [Chlamydomonas eustigma]|uniref:Uncharacterized protein n=1 Tax=Chlamydomonas eustigma TaxID=1157962 RepID=A0A250WWI9_9CHLO|nr:hypothetical protein CEUSTIGMA_g2513.t1 [Chlamydomonas eustigma]|eukprot:GAX75069.1 hypothetical protein CEUSTIGMA_g2513.t1 [Chlamydomonas eustigma]
MEVEKVSKSELKPLPRREKEGHKDQRISFEKAKHIYDKLKCEIKEVSCTSQLSQGRLTSSSLMRREGPTSPCKSVTQSSGASSSQVPSVQIQKLAVELNVAPRFGVNAKALILQAASNLAGSRGSTTSTLVPPTSATATRNSAAPRQPMLPVWKLDELLALVPVTDRPFVSYVPRSNIPRLTRQAGVESLLGQYIGRLLTLLRVPTESLGVKIVKEDRGLIKVASQAASIHELALYKQVTSKQAYSQQLNAAACRVDLIPSQELQVLKQKHSESISKATSAWLQDLTASQNADATSGRQMHGLSTEVSTEDLISQIFDVGRRREVKKRKRSEEDDLFGSDTEEECSDDEREVPAEKSIPEEVALASSVSHSMQSTEVVQERTGCVQEAPHDCSCSLDTEGLFLEPENLIPDTCALLAGEQGSEHDMNTTVHPSGVSPRPEARNSEEPCFQHEQVPAAAPEHGLHAAFTHENQHSPLEDASSAPGSNTAAGSCCTAFSSISSPLVSHYASSNNGKGLPSTCITEHNGSLDTFECVAPSKEPQQLFPEGDAIEASGNAPQESGLLACKVPSTSTRQKTRDIQYQQALPSEHLQEVEVEGMQQGDDLEQSCSEEKAGVVWGGDDEETCHDDTAHLVARVHDTSPLTMKQHINMNQERTVRPGHSSSDQLRHGRSRGKSLLHTGNLEVEVMCADVATSGIQASLCPAEKEQKPRRSHQADVHNKVSVQTTEFVKAVLEPMYRAQLITKEQFKCIVTSAVEKILQRHVPRLLQPDSASKDNSNDHVGIETVISADFLITEAESIRKFVSKLVAFEKGRRK